MIPLQVLIFSNFKFYFIESGSAEDHLSISSGEEGHQTTTEGRLDN